MLNNTCITAHIGSSITTNEEVAAPMEASTTEDSTTKESPATAGANASAK